MSEVLVQIVFGCPGSFVLPGWRTGGTQPSGWPAILASLTVSALGAALKRPWLLLLGAVLFIPFSYYLSGAPNVRWFGITLPFFQAGAAYAVYKQNFRMAWLLISPAFIISGWLAFLVMTQ